MALPTIDPVESKNIPLQAFEEYIVAKINAIVAAQDALNATFSGLVNQVFAIFLNIHFTDLNTYGAVKTANVPFPHVFPAGSRFIGYSIGTVQDNPPGIVYTAFDDAAHADWTFSLGFSVSGDIMVGVDISATAHPTLPTAGAAGPKGFAGAEANGVPYAIVTSAANMDTCSVGQVTMVIFYAAEIRVT